MSTSVSERSQLQTVGRRYRRQGYTVIVEPRGDDLPPFLARFTPDLIAYNDRESVVVEVKARRDLPTSTDIVDLATAVDGRDGWRFDLALVKPERTPLVADDADALTRHEIGSRLDEARQLARGRQNDAALLLAWSAIEAALRLVARQQRIALDDEQPAYVIKQLYTLGVLSRRDYEVLRQGLETRDTIAHGFRPARMEPSLVDDLADLAEQLLQARPADLAI